MTQHQPCYRHPRHVWMAGCAECTAWHQAALADHRTGAAEEPAARHTAPRPRSSRGRAAA